MNKTFKAAIYETHGNPAEVLRVIEFPWPAPAANEVVVKMNAAPINPADLNSIEGKYPIKPALPATPGMEGAGVVLEAGASVRDLAVGTQVILPHNFGTWREVAVIAADKSVAYGRVVEIIDLVKHNGVSAFALDIERSAPPATPTP